MIWLFSKDNNYAPTYKAHAAVGRTVAANDGVLSNNYALLSDYLGRAPRPPLALCLGKGAFIKGAGGRVFRFYGAAPAVGKPSLEPAPYRCTPSRGSAATWPSKALSFSRTLLIPSHSDSTYPLRPWR